ncbi:ABC transporter substrate-binding protein [Romeriopsis navalis]|uniref:ABC transporter substrate-binding protein n=1 Tax=Romeriopsis navalis TaxID=2992132 RepID=UPI0021F879C0|nr:ABC transporter substrate-binding protein [Romeriopsis navalis]
MPSKFTPVLNGCLALLLVLLLNSCMLLPKKPTLRIGMNSWPGYALAQYAQQADFFKQRGLNVELVQFNNQQDNIRATLRGALDASFVPLWEVLQSDSGDDHPAFLMVADTSAGSDGIVARGGIESVADLRGKKVGVKFGTVTHLVLLEALKAAAIPPESVKLVDVAHQASFSKLKDQSIDAAVVWEPQLSQTAKQINGKVIFTTADVNSLVIDGLATRSQFAQSHQREFTQFMLAWFDAVHAVETQPEKVFGAIAQQRKQLPESFATSYAGLRPGDRQMNQAMLVEGRLQTAVTQITQLLKADPRHSRVIRQDMEINAAPIREAMQTWQP